MLHEDVAAAALDGRLLQAIALGLPLIAGSHPARVAEGLVVQRAASTDEIERLSSPTARYTPATRLRYLVYVEASANARSLGPAGGV